MQKYSLRDLRSLSPFIMFLIMALSDTVGCLRNSATNVSGLQSGLVLSGIVSDQAGTPQKGALVYIESGQNAAATTDASGSFSISLTDDVLERLKYKVPYQRAVFYLYYELSSAAGHLAAVSPFIEVVERGTLSLGTVTLRPMVSVRGKVALLPDQGNMIPAAGASVQIGRGAAMTLADGTYTLDGIAPGKVPYVVTAKGYEPYVQEWDTTTVDFASKSAEIVLFEDASVSGILEPAPTQSNLILVTSGHPFERAFNARASAKTRFIRYSSDKSVLLGEMSREQTGGVAGPNALKLAASTSATPSVSTTSATSAGAFTSGSISMERAPWHAVDNQVTCDFGGSGGFVLYYQFANESQTEVSIIYQIAVTIDLFSDTSGLKLNSGALTTDNPKVKVSVEVPAAAISMRLAESMEAIGNAPWLQTAAETTWQFAPPPATAAPTTLRYLYLQFVDGFKNVSPVYTASITLNLFPTNELIVVGDGSGLVTEANPLITLTPPARAISMRIADNMDDMLKAYWMSVQPSFRFSLTSGTDTTNTISGNVTNPILVGGHTIYVQFLDDAGYASNVYSKEFTVNLFPEDGVPFLIENGATIVPYRTVVLQIQVPPSAYQMRIFEPTTTGIYSTYGAGSGAIGILDTSALDTIDSSRYWIQAQSTFIYTFQTDGVKDLMIQFRDMNSNVSPVYKRTVDILPFNPAPGTVDFIIGDGFGVTTDPDQVLRINVPSNAAYMAISEDANKIPYLPNDVWQSVSDIASVHLTDVGRSVLTLRFRTVEGVMSQVAQRAIRYEPFPDPATIVVIDDGAATTVDNVLHVRFNPPITTARMRFSDDATVLATLPYGEPVIAADYTVPPVPGKYTIYTQMKLYDGGITNVFSGSIELVSQFPVPSPTDNVVVIDDGNVATSQDTVGVAFNLPVAAKFMRYCTECAAADLAAKSYASLVTNATVTFSSPGIKIVYVQFKAENGEQSSYYSSQIVKN